MLPQARLKAVGGTKKHGGGKQRAGAEGLDLTAQIKVGSLALVAVF